MAFAARFLCQVDFIDFEGARNPDPAAACDGVCSGWGRAGAIVTPRSPYERRTCWLHGELVPLPPPVHCRRVFRATLMNEELAAAINRIETIGNVRELVGRGGMLERH